MLLVNLHFAHLISKHYKIIMKLFKKFYLNYQAVKSIFIPIDYSAIGIMN